MLKGCGADRIRTCDPHNAIVVLYQLSYDPIQWTVNLDGETAFVKVFFLEKRTKSSV